MNPLKNVDVFEMQPIPSNTINHNLPGITQLEVEVAIAEFNRIVAEAHSNNRSFIDNYKDWATGFGDTIVFTLGAIGGAVYGTGVIFVDLIMGRDELSFNYDRFLRELHLNIRETSAVGGQVDFESDWYRRGQGSGVWFMIFGSTYAQHTVSQPNVGTHVGFKVGATIKFGSDAKSAQKLTNQMNQRGWTETSVKNTVNNPHTTREAINRATGNPATVYYTKSGSHVIIDNVTREIVQVSDHISPGSWVPDPSIVNPFIP